MESINRLVGDAKAIGLDIFDRDARRFLRTTQNWIGGARPDSRIDSSNFARN